jgi:hypothetical protein
MVRRLLDPDPATGQRRFTDRAFRYDGYQSSDLAYAVTGHSAQGATVHTGIALITGTEDRQWLYPAMTRGTACKTGDHDRAARHEHLAASYRALRDHYQQQEQTLAQAIANRQEWEHATAGPRSLAIAADAELRRRHPHQKIEPLRSGESAAVSDTGREQLSPGRDEKHTERVTRIRDLAAQRQASRAEMDEHLGLMVPGVDPVWGELGDAAPNSRTSGPDAILQPPRPEIIPSARLLQLAAEHDSEPDREAAD